MKTLMVAAIACLLLCAQGCLTVSKDESGVKADPYAGATIAPEPPTTSGAESYQGDASSNGGLGLRAAAPYAGQGTAAQQNVNPGPFLTAQSPKPGNAAAVSMENTLTRSADGTMSGPNDLPAATTGWGTEAATYVAPAGSTSRNLPKPKPAAPPK